MTKQEYASIRDDFTETLISLEEVQGIFVDGIDFVEFEGDSESDFAYALDERGYWLSGDEYRRIGSAIRLFESLVGRAHRRSV